MKHKFYKCPPGEHENEDYYSGCLFCDGGLCHCTICNGFEGTLTTDCCGHHLNEHIREAIYSGGLDFKNNEWTVEDIK